MQKEVVMFHKPIIVDVDVLAKLAVFLGSEQNTIQGRWEDQTKRSGQIARIRTISEQPDPEGKEHKVRIDIDVPIEVEIEFTHCPDLKNVERKEKFPVPRRIINRIWDIVGAYPDEE